MVYGFSDKTIKRFLELANPAPEPVYSLLDGRGFLRGLPPAMADSGLTHVASALAR